MIFGLLDLIFNFSIFSDFCRLSVIFALFRLILHRFWSNELPKILILIKNTTDTALSILPCTRAVVKVFLGAAGLQSEVLALPAVEPAPCKATEDQAQGKGWRE